METDKYTVKTKLLWMGLQSNYQAALDKQHSLDYVGTYQGFYNYVQKRTETLTDENKPLVLEKGVVIIDLIPYSTLILEEVPLYDLTFIRSTLSIQHELACAEVDDINTQATKTIIDLLEYCSSLLPQTYTLRPMINPRDYYKEVLATYNRVTFFDQFNTFKYVISKELRVLLEDAVYRYFSSLIDITTFREKFCSIEEKLKANQLDKFTPVKNFISSSRAEVLLSLVTETDQEELQQTLDEYALDYFDVNYLKAYLRDYGKTKEEKAKPKARVQELKL